MRPSEKAKHIPVAEAMQPVLSALACYAMGVSFPALTVASALWLGLESCSFPAMLHYLLANSFARLGNPSLKIIESVSL